MDKIELLGGACFSHGPYTFYKAVRIGNGRVLRLGSFFLTKLWTDADLVSIGELQLLWLDSRGSNQPLASLRLYFLPENTPEGRRNTHGEDEVLTISEKVVVRVHDLVTWLSPSLEWSYGREITIPQSPKFATDNASTEKFDSGYPQVLTDPGIDFTDVDKQQKEFETSVTTTNKNDSFSLQPRVVVLSYPRYCRYRSLLRKLEGTEPTWLGYSVAAALGGFTALPGTRVLFCRDTFDYPDLETHELLCNHLAPKLKGRPRRKRKKRSVSPGESSNESEASVASTSRGASSSTSSLGPALRPPSSGVRRSERNTSAEEKRFINDVNRFMNSRGTPVGKMPLLGYRQIDLFLFYTKVQKLGGYDSVSAGRLWKSIYDDIGGNTGSTSAATITRRHYERLLLPYERHQRGEETKVRPTHGRRIKSGSLSEDSSDVKTEIVTTCKSETPPPPEPPTVASPVPQLQSILSSSPFLPGDKPKTESGKTSSLRSVRVKPERLKSLNTIIANSTTIVNQNVKLPSPSPPPSSNASTNTSTSNTPSNTPSTTPTSVNVAPSHSVLERQLNSPLMSQQLPPSTSPSPILPVTEVTTNATTVVTLTPPPEKDMRDIKMDPKPATLLAQGKENIPLFGEKPIFAEKAIVPPKSPEVIDLEMENDCSRDKIVIPSFKKRKLEILREGGLEVTAVELEARPSVIQATMSQIAASLPSRNDEINSGQSFSIPTTPTNCTPKLISVTVTPDIGHMLPSPQDSDDSNSQPQLVQHHQQQQHHHHQHQQQQQQQRISTPTKMSNNHNNPVNQTNNNNHVVPNNNNNNSSGNDSPSSRVINVGSPNNANLLQLYANATTPIPMPTTSPSSSPVNHRFVTPTPTNERIPAPPKVTQSRSIFANTGDKMVYGNPKDIMIPQKYHNPIISQPQHHPVSQNPTNSSNGGVLDLTQKQGQERSFARPNLEIVRVPVVQRPINLNYDVKNSAKDKNSESRTATFPGYSGMLDSRTMASNNLEITLVNPKLRGSLSNASPLIRQPSPSPPVSRIQSNQSNNVNNNLPNQTTQRRHQNGKYSSRSEPVSPYATRKPSHPPVIPNVPNLHHLNNQAYSSRTSVVQPPQQQQQQHHQQQQQQQQQHIYGDKRKTAVDLNNHNHRRLSDSEKSSMLALQQQLQQQEIHQQQQLQQQQQQHHKANQRQTDSSRRHVAVPTSIPSGFVPTVPQNSSAFLPQQLPNSSNKFLPMLDPLYYSAFYNGLFPPPMTTGASPYIPPEFSAYYKELLASAQPRLAVNGQHQPAVPTSK